MKKNILSLILGTTLALPTLAMAMPTNNNSSMQPNMQTNSSVKSNGQVGVEGPTGKLSAAQSSQVNNKISSIKMNDSNEKMSDKSGAMENSNMPTANKNMPAPAAMATAQAPVQNAQAPNMQHSNADYQPLIQGEAASNNKTADAASTLQEKKKDSRGELLATQPANVQFKEDRRIAVNR